MSRQTSILWNSLGLKCLTCGNPSFNRKLCHSSTQCSLALCYILLLQAVSSIAQAKHQICSSQAMQSSAGVNTDNVIIVFSCALSAIVRAEVEETEPAKKPAARRQGSVAQQDETAMHAEPESKAEVSMRTLKRKGTASTAGAARKRRRPTR